jgi:hypothetical protein
VFYFVLPYDYMPNYSHSRISKLGYCSRSNITSLFCCLHSFPQLFSLVTHVDTRFSTVENFQERLCESLNCPLWACVRACPNTNSNGFNKCGITIEISPQRQNDVRNSSTAAVSLVSLRLCNSLTRLLRCNNWLLRGEWMQQ